MRHLIVAGVVLAAVPAFAQAPGRRLGPGPRPDPPPREEMHKMVDAYVVSNLQESVGLTDDQFVKILPLVKRLQTDRRAFAEKRQKILQDMRRSLESGQATEGRVAELMKDLRAVEVEEPGAVRKDMDALDAQLSTLQQAKLRLLLVQVEQRLRELMFRVRQGGPRRERRELQNPVPE